MPDLSDEVGQSIGQELKHVVIYRMMRPPKIGDVVGFFERLGASTSPVASAQAVAAELARREMREIKITDTQLLTLAKELNSLGVAFGVHEGQEDGRRCYLVTFAAREEAVVNAALEEVIKRYHLSERVDPTLEADERAAEISAMYRGVDVLEKAEGVVDPLKSVDTRIADAVAVELERGLEEVEREVVR
jgi:hypothetical protein